MLNDRRIRVAERKDLAGALLCTGFPPRERQRLPAQLDMTRALLVEAEDIRRTGSAALDLAYVASGRLDGYLETGLKPWDIAAGVLLVREAGGRCTDFSGGSDFYKPATSSPPTSRSAMRWSRAIAPHLTPALR